MLSRIYFRSNDGSQNIFVYQLTFNVLELKSDKFTGCIISWKSNDYIILNLYHYMVSFYLIQDILIIK